MLRRKFVVGSVATLGWVATGCTTTAPEPGKSAAAKKAEIDTEADATIQKLYGQAKGSRELLAKARGVLIFPSVIAAGIVVGGEYGEGVLRTGGRAVDYYRTVTGSLGLQLGAQSKAVILAFMTQESYDKFRASQGWTAGVDASVALAQIGANGDVDTTTAKGSVVGFVLTNAGLMYNLNLEGSKISKLFPG